MGKFTFEPTGIEGLTVVETTVFGDERGYFMETFQARDFEAAGLPVNFVQDNQSKSKKGVLRGLHFQRKNPQGKLVRVISGEVFDVGVDLRAGSPTFGEWRGVILSAENRKQFFVPEGFAHGFLVLSDFAEFAYKCTRLYDPADEGGIIWNDREIGVAWPLAGIEPVLSAKDGVWPSLQDAGIPVRRA
jgi:dTDP-4-dehydrorhamnose 3,5-epimerase